jgi:predicted  nucleic acid-binding Zn-ribbon protein
MDKLEDAVASLCNDLNDAEQRIMAACSDASHARALREETERSLPTVHEENELLRADLERTRALMKATLPSNDGDEVVRMIRQNAAAELVRAKAEWEEEKRQLLFAADEQSRLAFADGKAEGKRDAEADIAACRRDALAELNEARMEHARQVEELTNQLQLLRALQGDEDGDSDRDAVVQAMDAIAVDEGSGALGHGAATGEIDDVEWETEPAGVSGRLRAPAFVGTAPQSGQFDAHNWARLSEENRISKASLLRAFAERDSALTAAEALRMEASQQRAEAVRLRHENDQLLSKYVEATELLQQLQVENGGGEDADDGEALEDMKQQRFARDDVGLVSNRDRAGGAAANESVDDIRAELLRMHDACAVSDAALRSARGELAAVQSQVSGLQSRLARVQEEQKAVERERERLMGEIEMHDDELHQAEQRARDLDKALGGAKRDVEASSREVLRLRAQVNKLEAEREDMKHEHDALRSELVGMQGQLERLQAAMRSEREAREVGASKHRVSSQSTQTAVPAGVERCVMEDTVRSVLESMENAVVERIKYEMERPRKTLRDIGVGTEAREGGKDRRGGGRGGARDDLQQERDRTAEALELVEQLRQDHERLVDEMEATRDAYADDLARRERYWEALMADRLVEVTGEAMSMCDARLEEMRSLCVAAASHIRDDAVECRRATMAHIEERLRRRRGHGSIVL